jgi:hypothetical protein
MEVLLLIWIVCAIAAGAIASGKNRSVAGWGLIGFFFGPLGLLIIACLPAVPSEAVHSTGSIGGGSYTDELAKLHALHKEGVLTEAEFTDQKARLLHNR